MRFADSRHLHLVTYENGIAMQEALVSLRQQEAIEDQLLLLQHTPVITLGRGGKIENLLADQQNLLQSGVRFFETTRGGDITYHGPGQIVGYPILHLGEGNRDIRKYVWKLEEVLIRTVAEYGIEAARWEGNRGVWVGREKIAAIGVRIARWVTSHGFALNVATNLDHFRLITPCGIQNSGVTSIEKLTGRNVPLPEVISHLERHFSELFERELRHPAHDLRIVKVVAYDGGRVLLLKRREEAGGFWQPVTGSIESVESALTAAAREFTEETAMTPRNLEPLGLEQSFLVDPKFVKGAARALFAEEIAFIAEADSTQPLVLDAEEHEEYGWFTFEEAYAKIRWSDDREALEQVERKRA